MLCHCLKERKKRYPFAHAMAIGPAQEAGELINDCCGEAKDEICCMKVLGAGCTSCRQLYENAQKAVSAMGRSLEVEYITDLQKVMEYGVMSMPALVVNERVVSMGKVLKPTDIERLLHKLGF